MFRYLAFVWNDAHAGARESARRLQERLLSKDGRGAQWTVALEQEGLRVFHAGVQSGTSKAYTLDGSTGVVLGTLFTASGAVPTTLSTNESMQILATGGRRLIERYWGRYVAFLHDPARSVTRVLRDPSVGLPCMSTSSSGVEIYFSLMTDALALGLGPFSINWSYVAAHLCYQILEVHASALNEVSRVLGGECVEWRAGRATRSFYWNPLDIADSAVIEDVAQAATALRETTRRCVHAWAGEHRSIIHTLSGGLDSSIVVSCLRDAPSSPAVACVNYYSPGADSDERSYAQLAARHAGYEIIERERDVAIRLETLLDAPPSAYPVNCRYYIENSAGEAHLTRDRQATAIFCGEGGDQIFYQARASFAAGDYLCRRGLGAGLLRVALDAARLDRLSVWRVLDDALRQKAFGHRWSVESDIAQFRKLIPEGVIATVKADARFVHPILQMARRTPSGKLWHAFQLLFPAMDFYDPLGVVQAERITPLCSQPIVELCLRTPTDVLTAGGWDRAVARRAFQHDLPRKIVVRRTKGGLDRYARAVLGRNLPFIRELLLTGQLVRENLIDRSKLEASLSGNPSRVGGDAVEIFQYVNAEAWLQHWPSARQQTAA